MMTNLKWKIYGKWKIILHSTFPFLLPSEVQPLTANNSVRGTYHLIVALGLLFFGIARFRLLFYEPNVAK